MKAISLLLVIALGLACASAQDPCFARITATARTGSDATWEAANTRYQIYDITATNAGTCPLTRVVGFFSAGSGFISEAWNYEIASGLISGYGSALQPGQVFNGAGFVLANSSAPTLAFDRPGCSGSCNTAATTTAAPTTVPSTSAPTTVPSTSSPTTAAPASCPVQITQTKTTTTEGTSTLFLYNISIVNTGSSPVTTPIFFIRSAAGSGTNILTTSALVVYATTVPSQVLVSLAPNTVIAPGATYTLASYTTNDTETTVTLDSCVSNGSNSTSGTTTAAPTTAAPVQTGCAVDAVVTQDGNYWTDAQGRNTSVYHLTITNRGPCPLTDYATSFAYYPGTLISSWNLQSTRGGYLVTGYGNTLAAGASYSGAGLIIAGAPATGVVPTPYGSNCQVC